MPYLGLLVKHKTNTFFALIFASFLAAILYFFLIFVSSVLPPARADELSDIEKKKDKLSKKLDDLTSDKSSLEAKLNKLTTDLSATESDIKEVLADIIAMEEKLKDINVSLDETRRTLDSKIILRNKILRNYYKSNSLRDMEFSLLISLLPSPTASNSQTDEAGFRFASQSYVAQKTLNKNTLTTIELLNKDIFQYEKDKKAAEDLKNSFDSQRAKLVLLKQNLANQKEETVEDIDDLADEIKKVNSSLSDLSARQQELLREKFGATTESTTIGDSEQSSSTLPNPSFKPAFAFFTYGYPHRVGANQYGMYGRSKAGQNYKDIIKAYFKDVDISGSCDKGKTISVTGYGSLNLENTYLMGIAEMPESWGSNGGQEALKAQVVLARTYALNYTQYYWEKGSLKKRSKPVSICTTQSCQVYNNRKKTGNWKKAVEDTCGVVAKWNGMPITAWYASTSGGYTRTSGQVWGSDRPWTKGIRDAKCSGDLFDCAYDGPNYGKSPWFHKAWGTNKTSGSAWMTESEVADIFNAYLLSENNSSYNKYLSAPSKGGWSFDRVKDKLSDLGIKTVGKVNNISMKDDGTGFTTSVVLSSSNYSSKSFDGYKFKSVFNLRSPGTLVLWTSFYDIFIKK
ncbi:MAG: SpoIID/LytB domain-containing protein [Patescibacteria group bacterium]